MKKQNFIFVMCDDLGYGDVGFNGNKIIKTPHLDNMAGEGAVLTNFFSGGPVCSPTRGTCLTGRHYYRYTITDANDGALPKEEITIAQMLKSSGYATGHFGKWHLGTLSKTIKDGRRGCAEHPELYSPPWEHHFDECFSTEVQMPLYNPMENQLFPCKYWTGEGEYATEDLGGDDSKVIMDRALPFIEKNAKSDTPFFTIIWFHTPHEPVVAGPEHRAMYSEYPEDMQHYFGCITAMDEQVGRLNDKLKELGIDEDTCVWFCSDNGPEHEKNVQQGGKGVGSTAGLRGRKRSLFNGGINVPAFVKWNKHVKAGSVYEFLCSTLDYLPTIFADSDIEMPDNRPIDGENILAQLQGEKTKRDKPLPFRYTGVSKDGMAGSPTFGIVTDDYKVLCNFNENYEQDMMFNTFGDRLEEYDIAKEHPEKVAEYKKMLKDIADSFERSHNGHDYGVSDFNPICDYNANDKVWKTEWNK